MLEVLRVLEFYVFNWLFYFDFLCVFGKKGILEWNMYRFFGLWIKGIIFGLSSVKIYVYLLIF